MEAFVLSLIRELHESCWHLNEKLSSSLEMFLFSFHGTLHVWGNFLRKLVRLDSVLNHEIPLRVLAI